MQRKDLALRVLSTATFLAMVASCTAPAFAGTYYIGKGSIDVVTKKDTDGNEYVEVKQGDKTYTDTSDEIVIKDGNDEGDTTLKDADRAAATSAADPAATPATLEATGSADAAGESQPDPDAAFTLSEAEEDSAQPQEGKDTTEEKKEPAEDSPKKDVVYQYALADPNPEQQATKLAPTTSATPTAKTKEVTLDDAPAADPATPAEGSAKNPTKNVIRVINNWAEKVLNIRLSNVNIKVEKKVNKAAMDVSGDGKTKVELDGQNVLDSYGTDYPASYQAGLRKQGEGTLIITDETNDEGKKITTPKSESDTSGSLTAKGAGGNGAAGIGGSAAEGTKNITIEGYATVHATGSGNGAGIGGGGYYGKEKPGDAENIIIQGYATVDATGDGGGAGIGGGFAGNAKNIIIRGHSKVKATARDGAAIGGGDIRGDSNRKVVVNIDGGTNGKVKIGDYIQIFGKYGAISATEVNIGNNVLLKMKPWKSPDDKYINVNGAEAAVGTRNNPAAGGLVNTIGDNTELWYSAYGRLQKIVHGKNVCTKKEIGRKDATCTEDGWVKYGCTYESDRYATAPEHNYQWTETIPALGHTWTDNGEASHICTKDNVTEAHSYGEWTTVTPATCTTAGQKQRTCTKCGHVETQEIPATGHHWKDNGDGTHTCPDCGATEGQPFNTNSALELRVVDAGGMNQPFTVSQNGTLRTYTGAYDTATLTGDLDTLRYLQDHGAQTIQFVTNGQTSSFAINDLLAQGSGSEVFYLTHRGAEEPTLLLVEADHSELVKD